VRSGPLRQGSSLRSWARRRFPRVREVVLGPRRMWHHRQWVRRHQQLSVADRELLTDVVLPSVRWEAGSHDVLFVGVEWYTAEYPSMFPDGNLVTMDVNEAVARYGAPRHVTGDVRELDAQFAPETFAAIVCNGVFGYGVDSSTDVAQALRAMRACLRPGGIVVVGWNDTDERRVPDLADLAGEVGLEATSGAGMSAWRTGPIGPLRHLYDVYRRPSGADEAVGSG